MTSTKKTFGQHIEDGLTFMGYSFHNTIIDAKDHELEQIQSGFINDEYKLRMLKADLYQAARTGGSAEHIQNLRSAITTISNQLETDRNHRNSFTEQFYSILNSTILLAVLAGSFSFPMALGCNFAHSQSKACQVSRIVPYKVLRFFSEPK